MEEQMRLYIRLAMEDSGFHLHTSMDNNMYNLINVTRFPSFDTSARMSPLFIALYERGHLQKILLVSKIVPNLWRSMITTFVSHRGRENTYYTGGYDPVVPPVAPPPDRLGATEALIRLSVLLRQSFVLKSRLLFSTSTSQEKEKQKSSTISSSNDHSKAKWQHMIVHQTDSQERGKKGEGMGKEKHEEGSTKGRKPDWATSDEKGEKSFGVGYLRISRTKRERKSRARSFRTLACKLEAGGRGPLDFLWVRSSKRRRMRLGFGPPDLYEREGETGGRRASALTGIHQPEREFRTCRGFCEWEEEEPERGELGQVERTKGPDQLEQLTNKRAFDWLSGGGPAKYRAFGWWSGGGPAKCRAFGWWSGGGPAKCRAFGWWSSKVKGLRAVVRRWSRRSKGARAILSLLGFLKPWVLFQGEMGLYL
ncbi:hypothetical protein M5K25_003084 [Dendrobium thyrsiflorum]|uniref:Uncharacterized protein n=1 Tax=Dendrobium thyrsiflorum TaxID=117978 RepID=A0ABD0VY58_DENTH